MAKSKYFYTVFVDYKDGRGLREHGDFDTKKKADAAARNLRWRGYGAQVRRGAQQSNPSRVIRRKSMTVRNAASVKITQSPDGHVDVVVRRKGKRR